ncbi:MAG TPA: 4Fe-4S binding protein [Acidimicrobiia bacterium]|nr:4Fe-4S binding protein [Acidimicrobiia bacterium]
MNPALVPYPLRVLLGRVVEEWESRHRIFDMPSGRFHRADPATDLSVLVGRRPAATPIGPAAGPHTQMAQNIALGWLGGARSFELKTVQILDELEIPRPCIDMESVGYNVEWSQELRIAQSLEEYVKAWVMVHLLREWEPLRPLIGDPGPHVFDMSVGYDLAGISSPPMRRFIEGLLDAGEVIERHRSEIPDPFPGDVALPPRLVDGATLSTFHGCPPDEIEAIARHRMDEYGLDVVVKLNPTLLGHRTVATTLARLGYDDVLLDEEAFRSDLRYERALEMIASLQEAAEERGLHFGIKLTNTLVVGNHRGLLPGDTMYLSGRPLHVLAISLLDRLVADLPGVLGVGRDPGPVQVSFSAGIDRDNVSDAVGLGLVPVTVCTNLLKPGGYGNLSGMLRALTNDMHESGCPDVQSWIDHREDEAVAAGHRDAVAALAGRLGGEEGVRRYGVGAPEKRLREVDRDLGAFDCVSCNLCVTVCPNDAMFHVATPEDLGLGERWQYLCLAELCNDCGNCTTFCPERGEPFRVKPRVFLRQEVWEQDPIPGYLVTANGGLSVTAAEGAIEPDLVRALITEGEGLPVRPGDL